VGGTREVEVDVRILAATNADLEERVKSGEFREDLYYRLNVVQLHLPPLRERAEDVHALVSHFVTQVAEQYGKPVSGVAPDALQALKLWNYPGNVRELRNVIERAVALSEGTLLRRADLPDRMLNQSLPPRQIETPTSFPDEGMNLDALLASVEKRWLVAAMEQADGNKTQAARLLQMSFRSFRYRLAKYDLDT
jgi:two-component system response regulator PilR (NtrC family)